MPTDNKLDSNYLKQNLRKQYIGKEILFFNSVTSTNDVAKRFASNPKYDGAVIVAETQTRGKGRQNRQWTSQPYKGLWFSIILQPKQHYENLGLLSLLAGNAVRKAVKTVLDVEPELKWPNDVFLNRKKIAGILLESLFQGNELNYVLIGIGINISQTASDFPNEFLSKASSLFVETKKLIKREDVLLETLDRLQSDYFAFLNGSLQTIVSEWNENNIHKDKSLRLSKQNGEIIEGQFQGVDTSGNLRLLTNENHPSVFTPTNTRIL